LEGRINKGEIWRREGRTMGEEERRGFPPEKKRKKKN